jgi:hypothetical protein
MVAPAGMARAVINPGERLGQFYPRDVSPLLRGVE